MDEAAFEEAFQTHHGQVVAHARRRDARWDRAHDVAAEVFTMA